MSFVRAFNKRTRKSACEKSRRNRGSKEDTLTAADLLDIDNPLHKRFLKWCKEQKAEPTKRKAREFIQFLLGS